MEQPKAVESPKGHLLSEVTGLPETFVAMLGEHWISTVEEAVAWLAADGVVKGDAERNAFLDKARELLGENLFVELMTPVSAKALGCELPDETKDEQL